MSTGTEQPSPLAVVRAFIVAETGEDHGDAMTGQARALLDQMGEAGYAVVPTAGAEQQWGNRTQSGVLDADAGQTQAEDREHRLGPVVRRTAYYGPWETP